MIEVILGKLSRKAEHILLPDNGAVCAQWFDTEVRQKFTKSRLQWTEYELHIAACALDMQT